MDIGIKIDTSELDKLAKEFKKQPSIIAKGAVSAINKTLSSVDTKLQREITTRYNIKKSELKGGGKYAGSNSNNLIKERKATFTNPHATITVRGSRLTLGRFIQRPKEPVSHAGKSQSKIKKIPLPTVKVLKGQSKRITSAPHAFVAKKHGVNQLFERDGKRISIMRTLSTAQMASNKDIIKSVQNEAQNILSKKLEQEIAYRNKKMQGAIK